MIGVSPEGYLVKLIVFPEFGPPSTISRGYINGELDDGTSVLLAKILDPERRWKHQNWTEDDERAYAEAAVTEARWFVRSVDPSYVQVYLSWPYVPGVIFVRGQEESVEE